MTIVVSARKERQILVVKMQHVRCCPIELGYLVSLRLKLTQVKYTHYLNRKGN
jgi:hypothetical protein